MIYTLQNDDIVVQIASYGAELRSVKSRTDGYEYMWSGDSAYWGRVSPVLFPLVGNYRDKESVYDGKTYTLGQHGFARDTEFACVEVKEDEIWFEMVDSEDTLSVYPFHFILKIGYKLVNNTVEVIWNVQNTDERTMYFSIGAHPAFVCDLHTDELEFETADAALIAEYLDGPCVGPVTKELPLIDGKLALSEELLADNALILEKNKISSISLLRKSGKGNVTVSFDTPVVGIWSPEGKNAPFVCIEPWYGRADRTDFNKNLTEREFGNVLQQGEEFLRSYTMKFH